MSAAAKPWKAQGEQDRRTKMVTSSVHAHAKKEGAGGQFTWGGVMDVTDFEPVGISGVTKVVTAAPAPVQFVATQVAHPPPAAVQDPQQFPALGACTRPTVVPATSARWAAPAPAVYAPAAGAAAPQAVAAVPVAAPAPAAAASPTAGVAPRVVLGEDMLRPGLTVLDGTHPRNTFARKPHKPPPAGSTQLAIDWNAAGTASFQKQVIHAVAANPAHLGPYVGAKPGPPLAVLQAAPSPAAYVPNPKLSKQVMAGPKFGKPQVMFQRKC